MSTGIPQELIKKMPPMGGMPPKGVPQAQMGSAEDMPLRYTQEQLLIYFSSFSPLIVAFHIGLEPISQHS